MENRIFEEEEKLALTNYVKNRIFNEFFDETFKVASDDLFKLPKKGILYPERENPRNLFERQLILENESNEISVEKFLNTYESLQNFGLAHNLSFARTFMIKWFPQLCQAIREEQEKCLIYDLSADRAETGPYLTQLKPEKIALISLSELMRNITKIAIRHEEDRPNNYFIISKQLFESIGKSINMQIQYEVEEEAIDKRLNDKFAQMRPEKGEKSASQAKKKKQADILKSNMVEAVMKKSYRGANSNNSSYAIPSSVQ